MMLNKKNITRMFLTGTVLTFSLLSVGCTRHPSEEELQILDAQIQAADDAEARVSELESEKSSLEAQLASEKQKLSDLEAEFEEIKTRKAGEGK